MAAAQFEVDCASDGSIRVDQDEDFPAAISLAISSSVVRLPSMKKSSTRYAAFTISVTRAVRPDGLIRNAGTSARCIS